MGWRELRSWLRESNRAREVEAGQATGSPDSWVNAENNPFWAEQRAIQARMRGR